MAKHELTKGELREKARLINDAHDNALSSYKDAVHYALKAGQQLLEAKTGVGHGGWLEWLKKNVRFKERQARNYMHLAQLVADKGGKLPDVSSLEGAIAALESKAARPRHDRPNRQPAADLGKEGATDAEFTVTPAPAATPQLPAVVDREGIDSLEEADEWVPCHACGRRLPIGGEAIPLHSKRHVAERCPASGAPWPAHGEDGPPDDEEPASPACYCGHVYDEHDGACTVDGCECVAYELDPGDDEDADEDEPDARVPCPGCGILGSSPHRVMPDGLICLSHREALDRLRAGQGYDLRPPSIPYGPIAAAPGVPAVADARPGPAALAQDGPAPATSPATPPPAAPAEDCPSAGDSAPAAASHSRGEDLRAAINATHEELDRTRVELVKARDEVATLRMELGAARSLEAARAKDAGPTPAGPAGPSTPLHAATSLGLAVRPAAEPERTAAEFLEAIEKGLRYLPESVMETLANVRAAQGLVLLVEAGLYRDEFKAAKRAARWDHDSEVDKLVCKLARRWKDGERDFASGVVSGAPTSVPPYSGGLELNRKPTSVDLIRGQAVDDAHPFLRPALRSASPASPVQVALLLVRDLWARLDALVRELKAVGAPRGPLERVARVRDALEPAITVAELAVRETHGEDAPEPRPKPAPKKSEKAEASP